MAVVFLLFLSAHNLQVRPQDLIGDLRNEVMSVAPFLTSFAVTLATGARMHDAAPVAMLAAIGAKLHPLDATLLRIVKGKRATNIYCFEIVTVLFLFARCSAVFVRLGVSARQSSCHRNVTNFCKLRRYIVVEKKKKKRKKTSSEREKEKKEEEKQQ